MGCAALSGLSAAQCTRKQAPSMRLPPSPTGSSAQTQRQHGLACCTHAPPCARVVVAVRHWTLDSRTHTLGAAGAWSAARWIRVFVAHDSSTRDVTPCGVASQRGAVTPPSSEFVPRGHRTRGSPEGSPLSFLWESWVSLRLLWELQGPQKPGADPSVARITLGHQPCSASPRSHPNWQASPQLSSDDDA